MNIIAFYLLCAPLFIGDELYLFWRYENTIRYCQKIIMQGSEMRMLPDDQMIEDIKVSSIKQVLGKLKTDSWRNLDSPQIVSVNLFGALMYVYWIGNETNAEFLTFTKKGSERTIRINDGASIDFGQRTYVFGEVEVLIGLDIMDELMKQYSHNGSIVVSGKNWKSSPFPFPQENKYLLVPMIFNAYYDKERIYIRWAGYKNDVLERLRIVNSKNDVFEILLDQNERDKIKMNTPLLDEFQDFEYHEEMQNGEERNSKYQLFDHETIYTIPLSQQNYFLSSFFDQKGLIIIGFSEEKETVPQLLKNKKEENHGKMKDE